MASIFVPRIVPLPGQDAVQIHEALEEEETVDANKIIAIVTHRTLSHRMEIRQAYYEMYEEDLISVFRRKTTDKFRLLLSLWMMSPCERDSFFIFVVALDMDEEEESRDEILLEIACSRTPDELIATKNFYFEFFNQTVEENIANKRTGGISRLMVMLFNSTRYTGEEIDHGLSRSEALIFRKMTRIRRYDDDDLFKILAKRSKKQIRATGSMYWNSFRSDLLADFEPGDDHLGQIIKKTIKCLLNTESYFATLIKKSFNEKNEVIGNDASILRIVTSRADVDLERIKNNYFNTHNILTARVANSDVSLSRMLRELMECRVYCDPSI